MPKELNFFTEGVHPVKVKEVVTKTSTKGNSYRLVTLYSGTKVINLFLFLPDNSKKYNPSSITSMQLEGFLNHTVNAGINPEHDDYQDKLIAGLELFDTPSVFQEKELKIVVGFTGPHVEFVERGKFILVDRKKEPLLGITTEYPTRDAAAAAFDQLNSKRPEPMRLERFANVTKLLAPDKPNIVSKIVKSDKQLEETAENDDEDVGF